MKTPPPLPPETRRTVTIPADQLEALRRRARPTEDVTEEIEIVEHPHVVRRARP